jgi:hypothetical protein
VVLNKPVIQRLLQGHTVVDVGGQEAGTDEVLGLAVAVEKLCRYRQPKALWFLRLPAPWRSNGFQPLPWLRRSDAEGLSMMVALMLTANFLSLAIMSSSLPRRWRR